MTDDTCQLPPNLGPKDLELVLPSAFQKPNEKHSTHIQSIGDGNNQNGEVLGGDEVNNGDAVEAEGQVESDGDGKSGVTEGEGDNREEVRVDQTDNGGDSRRDSRDDDESMVADSEDDMSIVISAANEEYTGIPQEKYKGIQELPLMAINQDPAYLWRKESQKWVDDIAEELMKPDAQPITILPVLKVPSQPLSALSPTYIPLGGNHLVEALKRKQTAGEITLRCSVYESLTKEECFRLTNAHNEASITRPVTNQDKVYQLRKRGCNSRKKAAEILTQMTGQSVKINSVSTYLAVSKYDERSWEKTEEIFSNYEEKHGYTRSMPMTLFKHLQALENDERMKTLDLALKDLAGTTKALEKSKKAAKKNVGTIEIDVIVRRKGERLEVKEATLKKMQSACIKLYAEM